MDIFENADVYGKDAPMQILLYQVMHVQKYKVMQYLDDVDIKPGQAGCLFILSKYGKLPQKEIARRLGVKPPSMTVLLRKLEKKKLVIRRQDEQDQRVYWISLTEEGRRYINTVKETMRKLDAAMFEGILPEERLLLRRLLMQIRDNLMTKEEMKKESMKMHRKCISELEKEE